VWQQQHLQAAVQRLAVAALASVVDLAGVLVLVLVLVQEAAGTAGVQVLVGCSGLKQKRMQISQAVWLHIAG
jgi:hypothetical protein